MPVVASQLITSPVVSTIVQRRTRVSLLIARSAAGQVVQGRATPASGGFASLTSALFESMTGDQFATLMSSTTPATHGWHVAASQIITTQQGES